MYLTKPRLYILRFEKPTDKGAGVAVVHNETIMGGDTWFYFRGTITIEDDDVEVTCKIERHTEGTSPMFSQDESKVLLTGKTIPDGFTLSDPTGFFKVVALLVPE